MKTKYEPDFFAVFQGNLFSASPRKGYVKLITKSKRIVKKYEFLEEDDAYYKLVSPYELTEYYYQHFKAKYQGKEVCIWRGNDRYVDIGASSDFSADDLESLGFIQVEKYVFEKRVATSELTDILVIKKDELKDVKKEFDEYQKQK